MGYYQTITKYITTGRATALVTELDNNSKQSASGKMVITGEGDIICDDLDLDLDMTDQVKILVLSAMKRAHSQIIGISSEQGKNRQIFIHVFSPSPRLIILGGGHVGAALCRMASQLDYEIILLDDRPSFTNQISHPHAHRLICEPFERALAQIEPSSSDYIVIVTRGHKHDHICLKKALEREAVYIGMIGSRLRVSAQLKDLAESGYSEEQLSRVYSPIGLSIGAVTEAEIALSILAEITRVRRSSSSSDEAIQYEVLQTLVQLEESSERAVLATIINTKGSTPRKTGTQMIIYPDGSLKGTIGGGCAEAEVRREALHCFDHGQTGQVRLKLTADAAADEGMACGGLVDIYLELLPFISPEIL